MKKTSIKLALDATEKQRLRTHNYKIADIAGLAADELEVMLGISQQRACELRALAEFQTIPTIGLEFAKDLVFLGLTSINDLKHTDGASLLDRFEAKKGFATDPCVEDQFRLAVYYAQTHDASKRWWDFTEERKRYRREHGYPPTRP